MISLTLTNVKKFMSQLLMTETFDRFSFIEGEIVTFNTFKLDGYLQKDFFDAPDGYESESSPTPLEEYSRWGDIREFCFSLIKGKRTPLSFRLILSLSPDNIVRLINMSDIILSFMQGMRENDVKIKICSCWSENIATAGSVSDRRASISTLVVASQCRTRFTSAR